MSRFLPLFFGCMLAGSLAAAPALDAEKATGGAKVSENGKTVALLPADGTMKDRVTIPLSEPLTPGMWIGEFELFGPRNFSPNVIMSFDGGAGFDCYFLPLRGGFFTMKAGFVLDKEARNLTMRFGWLRKKAGIGLAKATFRPATAQDFANLPVFMEVPVTGGEFKLPAGLPYGVYRYDFPKNTRAVFRCADGAEIRTPSFKTVTVAAPDVVSGKLLDSDFSGTIRVERYLERGSVPAIAGKIIPAIDRTNPETGTLVLTGGNGAAPQFVTYPGDKPIALVTSWDDGQKMDAKLTDMLSRYQIRGTLAMNRHSPIIPELKDYEKRGFEIASHSWSHPFLPLSSPERCKAEADNMRIFLEQQLGHPVISFVFPFNYAPAYDKKGDYVLRSLRDAGFWAARVTSTGTTHLDTLQEPLTLTPDFHFAAGPDRVRRRLEAARQEKPGAMIYLWGHSYELANGGDAKLDSVLKVLTAQPDVWYATQGEFSLWHLLRRGTVIRPEGNGVFKITTPRLHAYLKTVPRELRVPAGTTKAVWNGRELPIVNGRIMLP